MKTFLDKLRELKQNEVSKRKKVVNEDHLRSEVKNLDKAPDFRKRLIRNPGEPISLILEVKPRAPGRINVNQIETENLVKEFEHGGAKAISVLTDQSWFGGSLSILNKVSRATSLPLMHKEFIISSYQLLEGRLHGASAALILAYYFHQFELSKIVSEAKNIGLEAVVECSVENELSRALSINPDILMINNRPIAAIPEDPTETYDKGSIEVTSKWWESYPELRSWKRQPGKLLISASCINSPEDIKKILKIPCDAALIGNAAMTAKDRVGFLKSLTEVVNLN
mgnify:CR=1 FL=1